MSCNIRSPRSVCSRGSSQTEHSEPTNVLSLRLEDLSRSKTLAMPLLERGVDEAVDSTADGSGFVGAERGPEGRANVGGGFGAAFGGAFGWAKCLCEPCEYVRKQAERMGSRPFLVLD